MLTEKDYCDYDTCVALKELGFNEYCRGYFDPLCKIFNETSYRKGWNNTEGSDCGVLSCPSLYEAQKWLREEKNIDISVTISPFDYFATIREFVFWREEYSWKNPPIYPNGAKTYEEALSEGIKEAVKILKENEAIHR